MLTNERKRKKRRIMCRTHFGKDDIMIDGYRLNPVHIEERPYKPDAEFDFYLDTGYDAYLLRLRNSSNNEIILCKHNPLHYDFIYIAVEKTLSLSFKEELKQIVAKLKNIKIPNKIYEEIRYKVFYD